MSPPPLLVLAVGNPSRGDDALGSLFVDRAAEALRLEVGAGQVEFLTDFQLQIEHALDLVGRRRVVFVDASVKAEAPYAYSRVEPRRDESFSSHALSPAAVLDTHRTVAGEPPPAWVLAIRGERFELGEGLSPVAAANLAAALRFFVGSARSFLRQLRAGSSAVRGAEHSDAQDGLASDDEVPVGDQVHAGTPRESERHPAELEADAEL